MKFVNVLLFVFSFLMIFPNTGSSQSYVDFNVKKRFARKYKKYLEPKAELVAAHYHYTVEKTKKGNYILKKYYPEKDQITYLQFFDTKKLVKRDGKSITWSDDGIKLSEGFYKDGNTEGVWTNFDRKGGFIESEGKYENDKREGLWKTFNKDGKVIEEMKYQLGEKNGEYKIFDDEGNLIETGIYKDDEKIKSEVFTEDESDYKKRDVYAVVEVMPVLKGCDHLSDEEKREECSDRKLLENIYGKIQYPNFARRMDVEGTAYVQFVIDKKGKVTEINVIRGICESIEKEVLRVVKTLPDWSPGRQRGKPVKVRFTLPVKFSLVD